MNELSCNSICQLLCCPPVPSKIAAKLAFMPPPPSYKLQAVVDGDETRYIFMLAPFIKDSILQYMPNNIEAVKATTRKGNDIAMLYMKINPASKLTFLLSHGNAVDLGLMIHFMFELGSKLNVNIMCYDYSGYGVSTGKPLEKHLYADAECALNQLVTRFSIPLDHVVLYGQSIGTVPTVHLATLHPVAAVVLHSPLMSGLRVAFPRLKRNYCCDVFSNNIRAPHVVSPTLIIHGTEDEIIDRTHAQMLYELLPNKLEPLFIRGAGHNNCELFEEYLIRLEYLVHVEVGISSDSTTDSTSPPTTTTATNPIKTTSSKLKKIRSRLPKLFHRSQKSPIKLACRVSPSTTSSTYHQTKTSSITETSTYMNPDLGRDGETSTLVSYPTPPASNLPPILLHRRGFHGSYRYITRTRRPERSALKRNRSLPSLALYSNSTIRSPTGQFSSHNSVTCDDSHDSQQQQRHNRRRCRPNSRSTGTVDVDDDDDDDDGDANDLETSI